MTVPLIDLFEALETSLAQDGSRLVLTGMRPEVRDVCERSAWFRKFAASNVR